MFFRTFKLNCPVSIFLSAKQGTRDKLVVTRLCMEHNHNISEEIYNEYPENRRLSTSERETSRMFLKLKVSSPRENNSQQKNTEVNDFHQNCNGSSSITTPKETMVTNSKLKDGDSFMAQLNLLTANDPNSSVIITLPTDPGNVFDTLFIQTSNMKKAVDNFPTVIIIDTMYKSNNLNIPLLTLFVTNGEEKSLVAAHAFIRNENEETFQSLLQNFQKLNPCTTNTTAFVIDKYDSVKFLAIEKFYPNAKIFISFKNITKEFKKVIKPLSLDEDQKAQLNTLMEKLAKSESIEEYNQLHQKLIITAPVEFVEYYHVHWGNCCHYWVNFYKQLFSFLSIEDTHRPKFKIASNSSLIVCIESLINFDNEKTREVTAKNMLKTVTRIVKTEEYDTFESNAIQQIREIASSRAMDYILKEIKAIRSMSYMVKEIDSNKCEINVTVSDDSIEVYVVSVKNNVVHCPCNIAAAMQMPCRHLFIWLKESNQEYNPEWLNNRWKSIMFTSRLELDYDSDGKNNDHIENHRKRSIGETSFYSSHDSVLHSIKKSRQYDDDDIFCLSLSPMLRSLSDENKSNAKIEIQAILHKYNFQTQPTIVEIMADP